MNNCFLVSYCRAIFYETESGKCYQKYPDFVEHKQMLYTDYLRLVEKDWSSKRYTKTSAGRCVTKIGNQFDGGREEIEFWIEFFPCYSAMKIASEKQKYVFYNRDSFHVVDNNGQIEFHFVKDDDEIAYDSTNNVWVA